MVELLAWLLALPVMMALAIFGTETLFGLWNTSQQPQTGGHAKTVILMPAHNEGVSIAAIIAKLQPALSANVRLLVVADNCSDDTAQIVRTAGHDIVERSDPDNRGKGFALAFGREFLKAAPPQCVIVLDADCETDARSIRMLADHSIASNAPVQSRYVFKQDISASPKVQISNFAFWLKNVVRQRGEQRLGGSAILAGTGMAFPWPLFSGLPLATSNIVEDLALGIYLVRTGNPPLYLDEAVVWSSAASEKATLVQRSRWEHGFVSTAKEYAMGALWKGITQRNRKLFQLGLHLLVPPLALLFVIAFVVLSILLLTFAFTGTASALLSLATFLTIAGGSVFLAWALGGKSWLSFRALLHLPLYVFWKIPIFMGIVKGRTPQWNRTERDDNGSPTR